MPSAPTRYLSAPLNTCISRVRKVSSTIQIIIIIATLSILNEDEWEDSGCLYKACQSAITDGGLFRDTGIDERGENEQQSEK